MAPQIAFLDKEGALSKLDVPTSQSQSRSGAHSQSQSQAHSDPSSLPKSQGRSSDYVEIELSGGKEDFVLCNRAGEVVR